MDKQIIKALRIGMPITQIAKLSGVPRITLYWRMKNNKEYKAAREYHLTCIKNVFES